MKKKLVSFLAIAGIIMLVGCGSVPISKYNAPKSNTASSAITGTPLHVKYSYAGVLGTDKYYLYNGNSSTAFATTDHWNPRNKGMVAMNTLFGIDTANSVKIFGTIGDKVVFVFNNGLSGGSPLAVYDHSERKTYFLTDGNQKYTFLKKGTSYVVKLLSDNKYISLNNLREVNINPSEYTTLSIRFTTDKLNGRVVDDTQTIIGPYVAGRFMSTVVDTGKLPPLIFGPRLKKIAPR